jgi:hypothetical protein
MTSSGGAHGRPRPKRAARVVASIETFYDRRRRQSKLGMLSPVNFERGTLMTDGASLARFAARVDR